MISLVLGLGILSFGRKLRQVANGDVLDECVAKIVPLWIDIANICN